MGKTDVNRKKWFVHSKQFESEGARFKNRMNEIFKRSEKAWNSFLKPTINTLVNVIGMTVGAKMKNPQVFRATTII